MIQDTLIELTPRCSLTPTSARVFVAFVGATTFGVAAVYALQGMWPVLLFAGLECAARVGRPRFDASRQGARDDRRRRALDHGPAERSGR